MAEKKPVSKIHHGLLDDTCSGQSVHKSEPAPAFVLTFIFIFFILAIPGNVQSLFLALF